RRTTARTGRRRARWSGEGAGRRRASACGISLVCRLFCACRAQWPHRSWFALALVLVAALLHAAWNVAVKKAGGNHHFVLMGALLIVVIWGPLGLWVGWDAVPRWGPREWALI